MSGSRSGRREFDNRYEFAVPVWGGEAPVGVGVLGLCEVAQVSHVGGQSERNRTGVRPVVVANDDGDEWELIVEAPPAPKQWDEFKRLLALPYTGGPGFDFRTDE